MAAGDHEDVTLDKGQARPSRQRSSELQQRLNVLLDAIGQPVWLIKDGFCIEANRAARALLQGHNAAGLGRFHDLVALTDRHRVIDFLGNLAEEPGRAEEITFQLAIAPNRVVRVDAKATTILDEGSPAVQLVARVAPREVGKADAATAYSLRDPVTGLPSKLLFREELDRACRRSRRFGTRVLLVRIDVAPRSSDGRQLDARVLDRLAIALDGALSSTVRETDYVGRLGPLSFAVLGIDVAQMQDVIRLGDRVGVAVGESVMIDGVEWFWHMRMGGTIYPDDHAQPDMLIAHAENALMSSGDTGRVELRLHHSLPREVGPADDLIIDFATE